MFLHARSYDLILPKLCTLQRQTLHIKHFLIIWFFYWNQHFRLFKIISTFCPNRNSEKLRLISGNLNFKLLHCVCLCYSHFQIFQFLFNYLLDFYFLNNIEFEFFVFFGENLIHLQKFRYFKFYLSFISFIIAPNCKNSHFLTYFCRSFAFFFKTQLLLYWFLPHFFLIFANAQFCLYLLPPFHHLHPPRLPIFF